jgi:hypothetical protein
VTEQLALIEEPEREPERERLRAFTLEAGRRAQTSGHMRTNGGNPHEFERAVAAVRKTANECPTAFTADDVVTFRGPAVGAAFSYLRKLGEIEVVGYESSHRAQAHGRLVRVWGRSR